MHVYNYVGPFECQDGVTNNCSQGCTRNGTIFNMYKCDCDSGFAPNHFGYCEGKKLAPCSCIYMQEKKFITMESVPKSTAIIIAGNFRAVQFLWFSLLINEPCKLDPRNQHICACM